MQDEPPLLKAEVTNKSSTHLSNISVVVTVLDKDLNLLAVSSTLVESLEVGETREVAFSWPEAFSGERVREELYPRLSSSLTE